MALSSELVCVPDPRACANKLDPLQEMLPLCIRAIASGTDRRDGIAELGRGKLGWLRGSFPFAAGARFRFIAEPLVRFNDVYDPARVSKQKSLEPLLDWSEQSRSTILSSRSYWGYRGWQCARIAGYTSVVRGLRLFAPAALRGCYSPVDTARIAAQVLLPPRTYQLIATQVVALFGKRSRSSAP